MKLEPILGPRVTVDKIRGLFGNAGPVQCEIWKEQFDGCDDQLQRLARTPWEGLFDQSFWVYLHDLNYVELQPEVFAHLFPACLVMAQERLMAGQGGLGFGDSDLMNSLVSRNWTKVCTAEQTEGAYAILIDGFIDRLDQQRGFHDLVWEGDVADPVSRYNWIARFNSLGYILPSVEPLWLSWWDVDSPGQAVASLEYAWSLAVPDDPEDELDASLPLDSGTSVEADGNIFFRGWEAASLDFLASTLSYDYVLRKADQAASALAGLPEETLAKGVLEQVRRRRPLVEERIKEILLGLRTPAELRWPP